MLLGLLRFGAGFYSGMTLKRVCVGLNRIIHNQATLVSEGLQALRSNPRQLTFRHLPCVDGWIIRNGLAGIGAVVVDLASCRQTCCVLA